MTTSVIERRNFLRAALATGGAALALPTMLAEAAGAAATGDGTILVTVTLAGGNDGLNTVGPFATGRYRELRGDLAIPAAISHAAGDGHYFHPSLRRLATRYRRGDVAIVQGVGDPRLDRSHFSNLARWQTGHANGGVGRTGWLGRWLDVANEGPFGGVAIGGRGVPLHLRGNSSEVTDLPRAGGALYGSDRSERRDRIMYNRIEQMTRGTRAWPWVDAAADVNALAIDTAASVAPAYDRTLPEDRLQSDLLLAARLVNLDLGTRVLNIWQGGYDTHDDQIGSTATEGEHADLLDSLDAGLDAFFLELAPTIAPRVVVVLYSEFGRRVEPNGSRGTDHGTSSQIFVIGRSVKGGMYGEPPSLDQLDDRGDLRVGMDFRRVYSTLLEDWLDADADAALGGSFPTLGLFRTETADPSDLADRAARIRSRRSGETADYLEYHSPRF